MEQGSILGFQKSPGVCTYVKKANWGNGACNCEATYVVGNTTYAGCTFDSSQRTLPDKPWCDVSPSSCDGGFDFMRNVNGMEVPGVYCTSGPFVADLSDPPSPPPMTPPSPTPPAPPSTGRNGADQQQQQQQQGAPTGLALNDGVDTATTGARNSGSSSADERGTSHSSSSRIESGHLAASTVA
ncbi:hypothetical protein CHLRE_03g167668v5 [Chlamydomonas reinhardtii]|uniref:Uncharacterized protein n=1 Tax=Chlamydomonas reinhardtii TaxID=3055 RepID=A0A2K3DWU6_CHLRE|nr:uncharacterized protein CHLRE_03g167668v5 [Chlamydomonas reinhardtii]PNW85005.1 hypothetical protein CHLRE_03g167668v5 [Chlamydomonas reinhardtii]